MKADIGNIWLVFVLLQLFSLVPSLAQDIIFYRSEFEQVGDILGDVDLSSEGLYEYELKTGTYSNYYKVDPSSGVLSINSVIDDVAGELTSHHITVSCGTDELIVEIVDGYDYMLGNHSEYVVLDAHQETHIVADNAYCGYNNLWGRGTAQEGVDFRMATLCHADMPDHTLFIWDTPSSAKDFDGASVWSYISVLWGNRKGMRSDLDGFPFQLASIQSMQLDFDFEQLYGTEGYKIALNHFLTNESYLDNFSSNDGDFFLVFDQKGTWIPPYPVSLSDTVINNCNFARLYKEENGYEWRRVIIKNEQKLLKGSVDLKGIYDSFVSRGYLNANQYIPNIQIGLEVTDGFGALIMNQWKIRMNDTSMDVKDRQSVPVQAYPNPSQGKFSLAKVSYWSIFSLNGIELISGNGDQVDLSTYPSGIYLLKIGKQVVKLIKQ